MNETQAAIIERIDALAAKVGVAADHFWPALVQQAQYQGFKDLAMAGVGFAVAVSLLFFARRIWVTTTDIYDMEVESLGLVLSIVFGSLALIASFDIGGTAIMRLVNPEFYALRFLLGQ